jgi:hypothetical protein
MGGAGWFKEDTRWRPHAESQALLKPARKRRTDYPIQHPSRTPIWQDANPPLPPLPPFFAALCVRGVCVFFLSAPNPHALTLKRVEPKLFIPPHMKVMMKSQSVRFREKKHFTSSSANFSPIWLVPL